MNGPSPRDALAALARAWVTARPLAPKLSPAMFDPVPVPPDLVETITAVEPFRARALEDATRWLGLPLAAGIGLPVGLRIEVVDPCEPAPAGGWEATVAPLVVELSFSDRMSAHDAIEQSQRLSIERVALEDGRWRVVSLWSEEESARARAEWARGRELLARRRRGEPGGPA